MTMSNFWNDYPKPMQAMFDGKAADTRPADARALANGPWESEPAVTAGDIVDAAFRQLAGVEARERRELEQPRTPVYAAIIRDALGHAAQIVEQITSAEDEEQASVAKREAHYCPWCHAAGAHMPNCQMQQAHAMSHPAAMESGGRQHVSGTQIVFEAIDQDGRHVGDYVTVAREEYEGLRAEVEEFTKIAMWYRDQWRMTVDKLERLRKGRDEPRMATAGDVPLRALNHVADHALDPRLGMPQEPGEPVEPMSARRWRWMP